MQILLSCAKTMSDEGSFAAPRTTEPRFLRQAGELAARMAALTTDELARLLLEELAALGDYDAAQLLKDCE